MQTVGLVQLCTAGSCHTLNPLKAPINGLTFILYLGCIKSTAGHQTVSLTVQVLQTILGTWMKKRVNCLDLISVCYVSIKIITWLLCRVTVFIKKTCFNKYMTAACIEAVSVEFANYYDLSSKTKRESNTSWADISASSNWCFFRRLLTDAKSFP